MPGCSDFCVWVLFLYDTGAVQRLTPKISKRILRRTNNHRVGSMLGHIAQYEDGSGKITYGCKIQSPNATLSGHRHATIGAARLPHHPLIG